MFEDGIPFYTEMEANVRVYFPCEHVTCNYCQLFCRYEENFKRYSCRLTGEWLIDPFHCVGEKCPLRKIENKQI